MSTAEVIVLTQDICIICASGGVAGEVAGLILGPNPQGKLGGWLAPGPAGLKAWRDTMSGIFKGGLIENRPRTL